MDQIEPRSATDYDDRTTAAVKRVLVEIGQILGSFERKFAVCRRRRAVAAGDGGDAVVATCVGTHPSPCKGAETTTFGTLRH